MEQKISKETEEFLQMGELWDGVGMIDMIISSAASQKKKEEE